MNERMIDIASPARLSVRTARLIIQQQEHGEAIVPLDDIAALVVSDRNVLFTHAVLSELAQRGTVFIVCDGKHLPTGMLLPLQTHHAQTQVHAAQAAMKLPMKKRLWKQIVQEKLRAQGALLEHVGGSSRGFSILQKQVRSGDPGNVEARAAKRYWSCLFGKAFRRNADGGPINSHLNYGYAILRGIVCRSICAAGLHPSLSLHHHNRNDAFALADDLMEPFRPIVDAGVWSMVKEGATSEELSQESKRALLASLTRAYRYDANESRTLFDMASRTASSLVRVIDAKSAKLDFPTCWEFDDAQS